MFLMVLAMKHPSMPMKLDLTKQLGARMDTMHQKVCGRIETAKAVVTANVTIVVAENFAAKVKEHSH